MLGRGLGPCGGMWPHTERGEGRLKFDGSSLEVLREVAGHSCRWVKWGNRSFEAKEPGKEWVKMIPW